jgi:hypothetical protein
MARGWESKSVEQQQDEAASNRGPQKARLTPEQIAKGQQRKMLELSRNRILQQLEAASNPQYRQMLESALADLEGKIAELRER